MPVTSRSDAQVFLSYAMDEDGSTALALADRIEGAGATAWLAHRDAFRTGRPYPEAVPHAIRNSMVFLVLCSEASMHSDDVADELTIARTHRKPMIALVLDDVEFVGSFEYYLSRALRIPLDPGTDVWSEDLLSALAAIGVSFDAAPSVSVEVQSDPQLRERGDAVPLAAPSASGLIEEWTEPLVRRLFKESADPMRRMLRLLADADGAELSTNEIAVALNLPKGASSVAGMAGAAGRRVNSRYRMAGLPWETRWRYIDPEDITRGTETLLSLPRWICKVIREL